MEHLELMGPEAWETIRETMGEEGAKAIQHLPITKRDFKWIQYLYETEDLLSEIPVEEQTETVLRWAVTMFPQMIQDLPNPSESLVVAMLRYSDSDFEDAFAFLEHPSEYIVFEAVKSNGFRIQDIYPQTNRLKSEALKTDIEVLAQISSLTSVEDALCVRLQSNDDFYWSWVEECFEVKGHPIQTERVELEWLHFFSGFDNQLKPIPSLELKNKEGVILKEKMVNHPKYGSLIWSLDSSAQQFNVVSELCQEPLVLAQLSTMFKTSRLCRLAVRLDERAKWFSPYHLLEKLLS